MRQLPTLFRPRQPPEPPRITITRLYSSLAAAALPFTLQSANTQLTPVEQPATCRFQHSAAATCGPRPQLLFSAASGNAYQSTINSIICAAAAHKRQPYSVPAAAPALQRKHSAFSVKQQRDFDISNNSCSHNQNSSSINAVSWSASKQAVSYNL
jgi:hypothetical protein